MTKATDLGRAARRWSGLRFSCRVRRARLRARSFSSASSVEISSGRAIRGGDGVAERFMHIGEPLRALIIEVGERAHLELFGRVRVLRHGAVGVARRDLGLDANEVRRIQPNAAKAAELFSPLLRCGWRVDRRHRRGPEYSATGSRAVGKSGRWWSRGSADRCRRQAMSLAGATRPRGARMENAEGRIIVACDGDRSRIQADYRMRPNKNSMLRNSWGCKTYRARCCSDLRNAGRGSPCSHHLVLCHCRLSWSLVGFTNFATCPNGASNRLASVSEHFGAEIYDPPVMGTSDNPAPICPRSNHLRCSIYH